MDKAHYNKKGKYVGRTSDGLNRDKKFRAMGKGERTSHTDSLIRTRSGHSFRRKNANQYGEAEGGNEYTENRPDRSDIFKKGATIKSGKTATPKQRRKNPYLSADSIVYAKSKEPKVVRTQFEEEEFEYKKGGNAGKTCCYTIGGL